MVQGGFNHNIRYKNVLFHVQTEDYGKQKHQVVTQLFHSGAIICKVQTDYQEFLDLDDVGEQIMELMKVQHIKMLKDLVSGKIDIPEYFFKDQKQPEAQVVENSQPTLDLDKEQRRDQRFEESIAEFLEKKS
jgi:hypothetical protein